MSSPSSDLRNIPLPLGISIVFAILVHAIISFIAYCVFVVAREGDWLLTLIIAGICVGFFRGEIARGTRADLRQSWQQRRVMRLTKQLKRFFIDELENELPVVAADLTQGHVLRVIRSGKETLYCDPTGFYIFDGFAVARWSPTMTELDLSNPCPATAGQLEAIIERVRSYR